jgi:hypothetical protein
VPPNYEDALGAIRPQIQTEAALSRELESELVVHGMPMKMWMKEIMRITMKNMIKYDDDECKVGDNYKINNEQETNAKL